MATLGEAIFNRLRCPGTLVESRTKMREHTARDSSRDHGPRGPRDGTALGPVMASIVAAAPAAWPAIDLAAERFVRYLTDRLPQGTEFETALRGIHTSDLYLACACVEGNAEALAAFERHCLAVIDRALPRLGLDA